jgi:hypothetical protein
MQMRHLKACPRVSASSSRMRPRSASTRGVSGSLLASSIEGGEAEEAVVSSLSSCCWCREPGLVEGSVFTSSWDCWDCWDPLGEMTASRRASRSFCSRAVPSSRGVTTSASVYWLGPNCALSSPSTTRSTSSSSWAASEPLAPLGPPRLLEDVARPAALRGLC